MKSRTMVCIALFILAQVKAGDPPKSDFSLKQILKEQGYNEAQLSKNSMGMFEIEATLDSSRTLLLGVDNSGTTSYFDKDKLEKLGYTLKKTNQILLSGRKKQKIFTIDIQNLSMGEANTGPMTISATDFTERNRQLESFGSRALDGTVSTDLLIRYSAIIDVKNQKLYLRIK